jgi:hypothetical protein
MGQVAEADIFNIIGEDGFIDKCQLTISSDRCTQPTILKKPSIACEVS